MNLPSEGVVDVARLSRIYDNTTATYKFYWFVSIINLISANPDRRVFSFEEIIAGMIAEAWYPIHYFRLSFGKLDSLESNIFEIQRTLDIPIDANKDVVRETILKNKEIQSVRRCLSIFTLNVPYRFLSPWIPKATNAQVEQYSREFFNNCPYAIAGKEILVDEIWAEYLTRNASILKDYSFWNLSIFLQKRNPNVPDIPSKLVRPLQRAPLSRQHRFWDRYIQSVGHVHCIYTNAELVVGGYDLDHFIPWSFVVHDLMWNLLPSDSSINSSKSNKLPDLDFYLPGLASLQHRSLRLMLDANKRPQILEDFISLGYTPRELAEMGDERFRELYERTFNPINQIALNMGFETWKY